jgi:stress response protein YsnF
VVEEQLHIGKRETEHGRVRVRSYVVEKPVSEQVTLSDEHVSIQRRPVDRPVAPGEGTLQERIVELEEKREEPVVSKQARVKEELALKKDTKQRTETVSDKVRRTEVKVEDERGRAAPQQPTRKAG